MSRWSREVEMLDPSVDYERIVYLLNACEFAWDIHQALGFALFRTYAVPSISGLLSRTGEFTNRTSKRYDDTELILSEISENGQESDRGQAAITRMNEMHGRYRISNDDMLYVLSTFVMEPVRWLERFGWRAMSAREVTASVNYYRNLGVKMGIKDIPEDFAGFDTFNRAYEAEHFRYADTNAEIANLTRDLLLSFYLPKTLIPLGRPVVHALCDAPLRKAMGFPTPPRWLDMLIHTGLRVRAFVLRLLPARRTPRNLTGRPRPSYPGGYRIEELGTFKEMPARAAE